MAKKKTGTIARKRTGWRAELELLRAKTSRGTATLRRKKRELAVKLEPKYKQAKKKIKKWRKSAGEESTAVQAGVAAGWRELRKAYSATRVQQNKKKRPRRRA